MKKLYLILTLILLSSCATSTKEKYNISEKRVNLLASIFIEQSTNNAILKLTKKSLGSNVNEKAARIVKNTIVADQYNKKIIDLAKSSKKVASYEKLYSKMIAHESFKEIERLKVKKIKEDFESFIAKFIKKDDAAKKISYIQILIKNDFPNLYYADFVGKLAVLMTKYDNNYERRIVYSNVQAHLQESLLKINLYLLRDVPVKTLKAAIKQQSGKEYRESRVFIEKIQNEVNEFFVEKIIKKMGSEKIQTPDLKSIIN